MPLTEVKTVEHDGEVVQRTERKLYSLRELKDGKHIEGDIVERRVANAYDTARENIARMMSESGWVQDTLETEISQYLVPEVLGKAGIIVDDEGKSIEWDVSPTQSGRFFTLDPRHTRVDVPVFLRALKGFFAGRDWRGPEYAASEQQPRLPEGKALKQIDLRSSDARAAREGGLVVQKISQWDSDVEPGYYDYDHEFSPEFMADCNYFLDEVIGFCYRTLEQTYEGEFEEEPMLDTAEANDWRFTAEGAWA